MSKLDGKWKLKNIGENSNSIQYTTQSSGLKTDKFKKQAKTF